MVLTVDNCAVAYFTMRTLGYGKHGHILQLAAKFNNGKSMAVWIEPSKYVLDNASEIKGLKARHGKLFYLDDSLPTVPLEVAMQQLRMFLKSSSKPVVIVSHAGQFVFVLLLQAIMETDMVDQFDSIVAGLSDTLPRFIEILGDREQCGAFELDVLAHDILKEKYEEKFLEAQHSLEVLERLVNRSSLMPSIIKHHTCFEKALLKEMGTQYSFEVVENLIALRMVVTIGLVKKFAEAGVTCSSLEKIYREEGVEKLKQFLSEKQANGKPRFTNSPAVHEKLITFLKNPPKPRASENVQADEDLPEINRNIPIYAQIDPFKKRQDRLNREIDLLRQQQTQDYEDVDLLRRPDPSHSPAVQYVQPSWGPYQDVDSARNPYKKPPSGHYEEIGGLSGPAAASPPVDRYGPSSGSYQNIHSLQSQASAGISVDRYSRLSEGIYEDPDAFKEPAPEDTVEFRTKRNSQIKRADPSRVKRRAKYARCTEI